MGKRKPLKAFDSSRGLWKRNYGKVWGKPTIQNNNNHNYRKESIFLTPRVRRCRLKRASLVPARGLTREKVRGTMAVRVREKPKGSGE